MLGCGCSSGAACLRSGRSGHADTRNGVNESRINCQSSAVKNLRVCGSFSIRTDSSDQAVANHDGSPLDRSV